MSLSLSVHRSHDRGPPRCAIHFLFKTTAFHTPFPHTRWQNAEEAAERAKHRKEVTKRSKMWVTVGSSSDDEDGSEDGSAAAASESAGSAAASSLASGGGGKKRKKGEKEKERKKVGGW